MKRILITTALLAGVFSYAGGFRVSLQGVKQLAMAHTSAHTEDASVAFFNPAGISFIPNKLSVAVGGFGAISEVEYQSLETLQSYKTENPVGTPLYAAIAYKVTNNVSVGLSVTTPFGSTVKWADDWTGREIVQKMELKSFYFQPMVSYKFNDWASIGVSYIYAKGMVDWDKAVTNLGGTLNINDEKATGSGFGLGFYLKPSSNLDLSIAYRSAVIMKAENGMATFTGVPEAVLTSPQLNVGADGQDAFTAELPLVDEYTIGLTYKITPKWLVSADFNYHGWERYSKLTLDFENALVGNQADKTVLVSPKNFKNAKTFRIGTQYMLTDKLAGRLGYYFDESPYEDKYFIPETPSFDASVVTAGLGYKFGKLGVDLAAALSFPEARKVNNDFLSFRGQAKAKAMYLGLGFTYNAF
ncbi:OmpP1/FadL family transporter [Cloacibacterium normanense]|uniref:Outer membrane transport family protein n=1 Tax=Cloacibacterium normanense TaxID=237258 RepID=A0A1E5UCV9_9FLAO|nr:outer membrane protein transport protein [Cloacibacterium normanense]AZI70386.1 aromatic hydrocarbon degradation protein [Cloacibacterium normanense]OEL10638.1 outer membrane transport family protein [Cloacibacterium normanense]SDO30474.1 long-chain fatty acid transport protein [Cloacibacterium normanense]